MDLKKQKMTEDHSPTEHPEVGKKSESNPLRDALNHPAFDLKHDGWRAYEEQDYATAATKYEEVAAIERNRGELREAGQDYHMLAKIYEAMGKTERAEATLLEAFNCFYLRVIDIVEQPQISRTVNPYGEFNHRGELMTERLHLMSAMGDLDKTMKPLMSVIKRMGHESLIQDVARDYEDALQRIERRNPETTKIKGWGIDHKTHKKAERIVKGKFLRLLRKT